MHEKYIRNDINSCLAHLVEECGEVVSAVGKSQRFGLESVNPELPEEERETNRDWLLRELDDLEAVARRVRNALHGDRI